MESLPHRETGNKSPENSLSLSPRAMRLQLRYQHELNQRSHRKSRRRNMSVASPDVAYVILRCCCYIARYVILSAYGDSKTHDIRQMFIISDLIPSSS